jgi:4-amino-4-deoxy-L-arabinose transferase-like glycosyltransferase
VSFLQINTQDTEYLVAVPSSQVGSPLVLATGRPVLYMGGFGGKDPVIDTAGLAELVAEGELRYVIFSGGRNSKQGVAQWLQNSCSVVPGFSQSNVNSIQRPGNSQPTMLYQCG